MTTVGHRRYVAVLLPFDKSFKIDEQAYRRYVRYFADDPRFAGEGGLCINPEAGEIFYLSREEKRRVLEIAMEEAHGKLPIIAGTWALTTEETVETAKDCKALGVDGIFVTPPGGAQDVTSCWDADGYPEIGSTRSSRRIVRLICLSSRIRSVVQNRLFIPAFRCRRHCASAARSRTSSAGR